MVSNKLIFRFIICFFFSFFLFIQAAFAIDTEEINVESLKTTRLLMHGITKFVVVNPDIARIELSEEGLLIRGVEPGTTPMYIWKEGDFLTYVVNTLPYRGNVLKKFYRRIPGADEKNALYGFYNIQSNGFFINRTNSESVIQNFYYDTPFWNEGRLNVNLNLITDILDLKDLNRIDIQNFQLGYKSGIFSVVVGDTNIFNPLFQLNSLGSSIKGGKFTVNFLNNNLALFSGIKQMPLSLYNKKAIVSKNNEFINGFFDTFNFSKDLDIFLGFISSLDLNSSQNNNYNLGTGFKWNPLKNFSFNGNIASNFKALTYSANNLYRYNWTSTGEWAETYLNYLHFDKGYLSKTSLSQNSYTLGLRTHHISGLNFSVSDDFNIIANVVTQNTLGLRLDKEINKAFKIYGNSYFQNTISGHRNNFEIGSNINFFFPVNLNYKFIDIQSKNETILHQFETSIKLFKTNYFNLSMIGDYRIRNLTGGNDLSANAALFSDIKLFPQLGLNVSVNYLWTKPFYLNGSFEDSVSTNLRTSYKLNNSEFSFGLGVNKPIRGNYTTESINSFLSYTYNFGNNLPVIMTGDIKGVVFEDLNNNGLYDINEKIFDNVKLIIKDLKVISGNKGFIFKGLEYEEYSVLIDPESLPEGYRTTTEPVKTVTMDAPIIEVNFGIRRQVNIKGVIYGNKKHTTTLPDIKITLDDNDETFSDAGGNFQFKSATGKHKVGLNINSMPSGYTLADDINQEVILTTRDQEINFTFLPVISLEGFIYFSAKENEEFKSNSIRAGNLSIIIDYNDKNGEKVTKQIKTDKNGRFNILGLSEGEVKINSLVFPEPVIINIEPQPAELVIKIPVLK
jgi:hypothetical protein